MDPDIPHIPNGSANGSGPSSATWRTTWWGLVARHAALRADGAILGRRIAGEIKESWAGQTRFLLEPGKNLMDGALALGRTLAGRVRGAVSDRRDARILRKKRPSHPASLARGRVEPVPPRKPAP